MLGNLLAPDGRFRSRYRRASRQLKTLSLQLSRIVDDEARARGIKEQGKLVRLSSDIGSRVEELPVAKGRSFAWLRRDLGVLLDRFEISLRKLKRQIAGLEQSKETVEEVSMELSPRRLPPEESTTDAVEEKPVEEKSPEPLEQENVQPEYQEPAWAEPAAMNQRHDLAIVKPAGPPKDVDGAERHLPCLATEFATWIGEWNQAGANIAYLEVHVPEGVTSIQWRHALREATIKHRHAKERIGKCRRWVQGEAMLLAARSEDWQRDFAEAKKAVLALKRKIRHVIEAGKNPRDFKSQDDWNSNVERVKTTRIRPGMLAQELERMGIPLEPEESACDERS